MATRFKIFLAAILAMLVVVVLVQVNLTDKQSRLTESSDGGKVVAVPPLAELQQEPQPAVPLEQENVVGQPADPLVEMASTRPEILARQPLAPPAVATRREPVLKGSSLPDKTPGVQPGLDLTGASRKLLTEEERRRQTPTAEIEITGVPAQRFRSHCRRVKCSWPFDVFNRPIRSVQAPVPSEETRRDRAAVQIAAVVSDVETLEVPAQRFRRHCRRAKCSWPYDVFNRQISTTPATTQMAALTSPEGAETPAQVTGANRGPQAAPIVNTSRQEVVTGGGEAKLANELGFDIVQLSATGPSVIAGRGEPNCVITVLDGGQAIGEVTADRRGEWVLLPEKPLPPGSRELSLSQVCGDGLSLLSPHVVVLVVPEPGEDIGGRPTKQSASPLAVKVERGGGGPAVVLQAPNPPVPTKKVVVGELAVVDEPLTPGGLDPAQVYDPMVRQSAGGMPISLDAVNYTDQGDVVVAGRAPPGARLRVYLDNRAIGEAESDGDGRWSLTPVRPIAPGFYLLRVDQIDQEGMVVARVELPFLRAEPLTEMPDGTVAVVQPGNSLWRIARRVYGKGMQYAIIYQANAKQIRDPDLIYPGQIFVLPRTN